MFMCDHEERRVLQAFAVSEIEGGLLSNTTRERR